MIKNTQKITLDLSGKDEHITVFAKQFDKDKREINCTLTSDGIKVNIWENETVEFRCLKPDNTSVLCPASINEDGTVSLQLIEQALAQQGLVKADIVITDSYGIISSAVFYINVLPAATNGNYVPSTDYMPRTADFNMNNYAIKNVKPPSADGDATNKEYVDNLFATAVPTLVTFNSEDFEGREDYMCSFMHSDSDIIFIVAFDSKALNFDIPDGANLSLHKVLIEGEEIDYSLLEAFLEEFETYVRDYGEMWINEDGIISYMHQYNFGSVINAVEAYEDISALDITGFRLLVESHNTITAQVIKEE